MTSAIDPGSQAKGHFAPVGLYEYIKSLPFLGSLKCDTRSLTAGQWTELKIEYTVGGSGLADGAWIKGTFKFYSDWALLQTSDPARNNFVSVEYYPGALAEGQTPATVQSLSVRFDQKGHERPFQKAIIIDVVDGFMNPGDKILVRIGDRRWGAKGTRVQTFVEQEFLMRWYIDPIGTSRFAPIKPDLAFPIVPGSPSRAKIITPRVGQPGEGLPVHVHLEDQWGNATTDLDGYTANLKFVRDDTLTKIDLMQLPLPNKGWTAATTRTVWPDEVELTLYLDVRDKHGLVVIKSTELLSIVSSIPAPRPLFADLHVHSDDTVGTNSTTYNFTYGQQIAGLDIIGYTANDFNITKQRWDATLEVIKKLNVEGGLVIYPGTEWCGNSAAGGDHNVVFLSDAEDEVYEFPFDKEGKVARSFEWNEDGPAELTAGKWPLDDLYATYAHSPEKHLLIPHVGGRRCNLAWHHPQLERLLEIGSAWGLFEWLLRDAVQRGWKLGVCANSDEHRGRCGGGVPGTAVFGTKGGLTGVLAPKLDRKSVAQALRARRTFATTGERLVGLLWDGIRGHVQGDEWEVKIGEPVFLNYAVYGSKGFACVEIWDAGGKIFARNLLRKMRKKLTTHEATSPRKIRVRWGGARLYDRYREAVWRGSVLIAGAKIESIEPFGGVVDNPEEETTLISPTQVLFETRTSGDFDGVDILLQDGLDKSVEVSLTGQLGGYVKLGNPLDGSPHKPQPTFSLVASGEELKAEGGKEIAITGGVDLFVSAEALSEHLRLPYKVEGQIWIDSKGRQSGEEQSVYLVGREYSGGKVITSPVFIKYV